LLVDTTGMYPHDMSRISIDARCTRAGCLEKDGVGEIRATYGVASERLVGLADPCGKAISRPREAA
jgi:hypothetical protein